MSDPTDTSQMIVGYSPGDFFYSTASNPPTNATCKTLFSDAAAQSLKCNLNFTDNSKNCINLELCKNSAAVKQMHDQNTTKWKTDELNYDTLAVYRTEYIFMWNLGIATVAMMIAIYYLYSNTSFTKTLNNAVNTISKRFPQMSNSIINLGTTGGPGIKPKMKNNTDLGSGADREMVAPTTIPKK